MDSEGAYWMGVDNLPEKYGEGPFPSSLRKISFQGIVPVLWHSHTQLMLRELDRNYAKSPAISPGKGFHNQARYTYATIHQRDINQ
ncbi:unnamed protein product [Darwinula stevensoni]|uniref:Uncharacterized protein n=1 Tax=Darwinula stevensoni TaxID=69355 RepID=A0A7R9AFC5_9CRUS|nr:unnamed protein product [Darwinula stevensoni]CAG0902852.1 unnamed protein product [Darwinula stevensoni]